MHAPVHSHATGESGDDRYGDIRRVTLIGAVIDLLLGVTKIAGGWIAQSQALIADGIHSLSDLATDAMVLYAAKHGSREADEGHPYGHGRVETVATVILGAALVAVAAGIMIDAANRLLHPEKLFHPGVLALVIAGVSVLAKEWIYRYTLRVAERLRSSMLRANAWHSRSDAISSIVVMIGVGGTMAGLPYLDALAAVVVAMMVAKIGWDLSWQSLQELIDTALEAERVGEIRRVIEEVPGVGALHLLRTRRSGGAALVDVHVQVEPTLSVSEGHQIGENVRSRLLEEIDEVTDVTVHIDPENDEEKPSCGNLPARDELIAALYTAWAGVLEAEKVDDITLHYLGGKVHVDVVLSLELAGGDVRRARDLSGVLVEAAERLDEVGEVRVYFH